MLTDEIDKDDEYGYFIDIEEEYYRDLIKYTYKKTNFTHIIEIGEDIIVKENHTNHAFINIFYFITTSYLFFKLLLSKK